jgi:hypothetical protein
LLYLVFVLQDFWDFVCEILHVYLSLNDDEIDNPNTVKPIFLQDQDIFGSVKATKHMWVTHVEIYKTIGASLCYLLKKSIYVFFWNVH